MISICDPADLPQSSCEDNHQTIEAVCRRCGKPGDAVCPHCDAQYDRGALLDEPHNLHASPAEMLTRFARLARLITSKRNGKFWWCCYLVATGDASAAGVSMTEIGNQWSVSRAYVSKTCVQICVILGIPPSQYMRTEHARESARLSNRRPTKNGSSNPRRN